MGIVGLGARRTVDVDFMMLMTKFKHAVARVAFAMVVMVLGLGSAALVKAAVTIPDPSTWSYNSQDGILWQGDMIEVSLSGQMAPNKTIAVVVSTNTVKAQSLPINLGQFYFTLVGDLTFRNLTSGQEYSWHSDEPLSTSTTALRAGSQVVQVLSSLKTLMSGAQNVSVMGSVRPVLICQQVPCMYSATIRVPDITLTFAIVENGVYFPAPKLINGSTLRLQSDCSMDISPTRINFGAVSRQSSGSMLASASTRVTAGCRVMPDGASGVFITLKPQSQDASDSTLALVGKEGLGVRYTLNNAAAVCTRSAALSYNVEHRLSDMTARSDDFYGTGKINWALCQTSDYVPAGSFTGRVDYVLKID